MNYARHAVVAGFAVLALNGNLNAEAAPAQRPSAAAVPGPLCQVGAVVFNRVAATIDRNVKDPQARFITRFMTRQAAKSLNELCR